MRHGGALDAARRSFPDAPQPWLDLSTGINPVAYPVGALTAAAWSRLPEAADLQRLEEIAGRRYGVPAAATVVAAPGTQAIIQRLPDLCEGRDVRILSPTYREFAEVFGGSDRSTHRVAEHDALAGADVAVVVNPNNPDGRLVPVPDLMTIAGRVGTLIVDEAFIDLLPAAASVVPRATSGCTIVLRSFGKTYGLAGLRRGFAVAPRKTAERLRSMLGPWAVSGPALAIGAAALADDRWLEAARERLASDMARLVDLLRGTGATWIGGTPLFALVRHPAASALFEALGRAGILIRPFAGEPNLLRLSAPGTAAGWARLESAISDVR